MKRFNLILILAAILATAAVIVRAQIGALPSPVTPPGSSTQRPVLTGENLGFRVERMDGDRPVGELVIRQNGLWVPVEFGGAGVKKLTLK